MPRMTHPDLPGQPIDVHPSSVGVRAKSGWVLDEGDAPTSRKPKPKAKPARARARTQAAPTPISEADAVGLGPDVAAGDADSDPASAGTHEE